MSDDPLRQILQAADAAASGPPEIPGDLAQRVRTLALRRQRVRFGLSAAAAIAFAVGMAFLWSHAPVLPRPAGDTQIAQDAQELQGVASIKAEIERLHREADMRLVVARRTQEILTQMRRAEELRKRESTPDPVAAARCEVEKAAYTLVYQADHMCRELDLCASAVVKYRRVVELFPDTPWAVVARQRLEEIQKKGDLS